MTITKIFNLNPNFQHSVDIEIWSIFQFPPEIVTLQKGSPTLGFFDAVASPAANT